MGDKKVEKREGKKKDKAEVDAESTKLEVAEKAMAVEKTQESVQTLSLGMWGRGEMVFMKRI